MDGYLQPPFPEAGKVCKEKGTLSYTPGQLEVIQKHVGLGDGPGVKIWLTKFGCKNSTQIDQV